LAAAGICSARKSNEESSLKAGWFVRSLTQTLAEELVVSFQNYREVDRLRTGIRVRWDYGGFRERR
jgi:hypothetical protein